MNTVFGTIALITSIVLALFGFPSQILMNYKRKSTEGFSFIFTIIALPNSIAWFLYGISKPGIDWFIAIANILIIVLLSLLLF